MATTKHNGFYNYDKTIVIKVQKLCTITCPKHGDFKQRPTDHLKCDTPCPKCRNRNTETAIIDSIEVHGDVYDYSLFEYIAYNVKVIIICRKHGQFKQTPDSHINMKTGCPKCNHDNQRLTNDQYIQKCNILHNYRYTYELCDYIRATSEVIITCRKHGQFRCISKDHSNNGTGCPKCNPNAAITNQEFKKRATAIHCGKYTYDKSEIHGVYSNVIITCPDHGDFEQTPNSHLYSTSGCRKCTVSTISKPESNILEFIQGSTTLKVYSSLYGVIRNKSNTHGMELDISVPSKMLAIEFDGIYWHSEQQGKDRDYHLHKTIECEKQGITLLHVMEDEWTDPIKRDVWKSIILNKLGESHRIHARKCQIVSLTARQSKEFFNINHLQGTCGMKVAYGLRYGGVLVAAISFGVPRYSKGYEWELLRMCNVLGSTVVGGFSKMLAHFRKNHRGDIISYANRRFSNGGVYVKLGFQFMHDSDQSYYYVKNGKRYHRSKFMKHKLSGLLDAFDPTLTEYVNMLANGYCRIWDCGTKVYSLLD